MAKDNVIELKKPAPFIDDPISEILRNGARELLAKALEAEIDSFLLQYSDLTDEDGNRRIIRNGYLPERKVQTGIGPVPVKVPRSRDKQRNHASVPIKFNSAIMPTYLRKTRSIETLIPWLYLVLIYK